ncbi:MAG: hypothetical protein KAG19_04670 [Methylococcales bacterium]|nr:hypothetical protein [Methylococcales bacterium]
MKKFLFLVIFVFSTAVHAKEEANDVWNGTVLSNDLIKTIQKAQYDYKKCVMDEMQKKGYGKMDSRVATGAIIKQCEKVLANMRKSYTDAKVPGIVADRHLKKMRISITRRVLKQLMFAEAARKAGQ